MGWRALALVAAAFTSLYGITITAHAQETAPAPRPPIIDELTGMELPIMPYQQVVPTADGKCGTIGGLSYRHAPLNWIGTCRFGLVHGLGFLFQDGRYRAVRAHYGIMFYHPLPPRDQIRELVTSHDPGAAHTFLNVSNVGQSLRITTRSVTEQLVLVSRPAQDSGQLPIREAITRNARTCVNVDDNFPPEWQLSRDAIRQAERFCNGPGGGVGLHYYLYNRRTSGWTGGLAIGPATLVLAVCDPFGNDPRFPSCDDFDLDTFSQFRQRALAVIEASSSATDNFLTLQTARFAPLEAELQRRIAATFGAEDAPQ